MDVGVGWVGSMVSRETATIRAVDMDDQCLKQRGAWQKKGWISPRTGTGNLVFFNNYYAVPAICFICSVKTFQHVGSSKRKSPATCSKKCKAILFAWYAHNRKNKR